MNFCLNETKWWYNGFTHLQINEGMDADTLDTHMPTIQKLQTFIVDIINKEKKDKGALNFRDQKEFPTLKKEEINQDENILERMSLEKNLEALRKNDYSLIFLNQGRGGSRVKNQFKNQWIKSELNSVYGVNNEGFGGQIHNLIEMFPNHNYELIKLVFLSLDGDFHKSIDFLQNNSSQGVT